jgi:tripartite-type tricarboxylate transporter receptor subunit TctC
MGDVREQFLRQGIEADPSTPAELTRVLREDTAIWEKIIKSAGIPIN